MRPSLHEMLKPEFAHLPEEGLIQSLNQLIDFSKFERETKNMPLVNERLRTFTANATTFIGSRNILNEFYSQQALRWQGKR